MQDKIKEFKNGAFVTQSQPSIPSGIIIVKCVKPNGDLYDKFKCYDKKTAREYFSAFSKIAKNF